MVILNRPAKVKSVILMEDMNGWRSNTVGTIATREDAIMCFKNVAVLHATFWGEKQMGIKSMFKPAKPETDCRPASYNKMQAKMRNLGYTTEKIQKCINKVIDGEWKTTPLMTLKKDSLLPDWLSSKPLEDGSYAVFEDPLTLEMLGVLAAKAPQYNTKKLKLLIKKPQQTMLHGDFHAGNHMYGANENAGKIVALDYQQAGPGRVAVEFLYFFMLSLSPHSFEELMEIAKAYHEALEEAGVNDYSWEEFFDDIEMLLVDMCVNVLNLTSWIKPKSILSFADGAGDKGEEVKKLFESGIYGKFFTLLTSIYLQDKERFLTTE